MLLLRRVSLPQTTVGMTVTSTKTTKTKIQKKTKTKTKTQTKTIKTTKTTTAMTNQAPNTRKLAQHIKNAGDRNERMLVRTITTILASVGTLVGWMALAADEPVPIVEAVAAEPTQTPEPAPTEALLLIPTATVAFAPIPTLQAIPGRQVLPTLMPTQGLVDAAPMASSDTVADTQSPVQPTAAGQTLRVVSMPTVAAAAPDSAGGLVPAAPGQVVPPAAPNLPAPQATAVPKPKPKPTPAGNSKGSK
jgi:hypothetical protein